MVLYNKIGIITFHDAINYGAALQSYALQTFLKNNGFEAETIDYKCEKFKSVYKILKIYDFTVKGIVLAFLKVPINHKKKKRFEQFKRARITLSKKTYDKSDIMSSNEHYDMFIAGSDQVWNLQLTGYDINYFLGFVENPKIRLSYAASTGGINFNEKMCHIFYEELSKFSAITVRECDSQDYLKKLIKKDIGLVLDPVFLLDRDKWENITFDPKIKKYILVYILHETSIYSVAARLADKMGMYVVCIQNSIKKPIEAEYVLDAGPEEFIGYIKNAEYVITDSFHGAAFSIIFQKNLKVVLKDKLVDLNSRIETLLSTMELGEAIVSEKTRLNELVESTKYDNEKIKMKIEESRELLLTIVKGQCL